MTNNLNNFQTSFLRFIECLQAFDAYTAQLAVDEPATEADLSEEEERLVNQLWEALAEEPLFEQIPPAILSALDYLEQSKHPAIVHMVEALRTSMPMICELCAMHLKAEELKKSLTDAEAQDAQDFIQDTLAAHSVELNETYDDLLDAFARRQSQSS